MPAFTDITGLAGIALALAATLLVVPGTPGLSRPRLAFLMAAVVVMVLAPLGTLPAAAYVRGFTGDLSITTLVLLGGAIFRRLTGWPAADGVGRIGLSVFVAAAALALYPMALGLGPFDPYRLGYGSPWFLGVLALVALAAWFTRLYPVAICIALAVLAWTVRWYESSNAWDYLLDPFVGFFALGSLARRGVDAALRFRRVS